MSWVVDTSLDHLVEGEPTGCLLVLQLHVDVVSEAFCHPIIMLGQVGIAWDLAVARKQSKVTLNEKFRSLEVHV